MKHPHVYPIYDAPDEPGEEYVARAVRAAASRLNPRVVMIFEGIERLRSLRRLQATDETAESKMQRAAFKEFRGTGGNTSSQRYAVGAMKRNVARGFTFVTEIRVVECANYIDTLPELRILGIQVPVVVIGARPQLPLVLYTPSDGADSSFEQLLNELLETETTPLDGH